MFFRRSDLIDNFYFSASKFRCRTIIIVNVICRYHRGHRVSIRCHVSWSLFCRDFIIIPFATITGFKVWSIGARAYLHLTVKFLAVRVICHDIVRPHLVTRLRSMSAYEIRAHLAKLRISIERALDGAWVLPPTELTTLPIVGRPK